jgi:hypothetical protein
VYKLSLLLHLVGHRVKTHNVTPAVGNERGDIEIKDYVILPHGEDDRIPPHTLVMDVTMTHDRYGRSTQHINGALTNRLSSTDSPQSDGALNTAARKMIRHYRQIYGDRSDLIVFLPVSVSTSGCVHDDCTCLLFLHVIVKLVF